MTEEIAGGQYPPGESPGGVSARFREAWIDSSTRSESEPGLLPARLVRACLEVLPAAGAGLSVLRETFRVPLAATDAGARLAERLQFTLSEGPCLTAAAERRVVVATRDELEDRWPLYAHELFSRTPYRAVVALPFALGAQTDGALDLYQTDPAQLWALRLTETSVITDEIAGALIAQSSEESRTASNWHEEAPSWLQTESVSQRMLLWVAIGVVMAHFFDLTESDALALLRSHAYSLDMTVDDLAEQITEGTRSPSDMRP